MRLRVLSDLHREFGQVELPRVEADIVVLAGDIDRGARGVGWARVRFQDTPVLYIAGNHEHYGERLGRLHEKLREAAAGSNVTILENEIFEWRDFRFFGATLWSDFDLFGDRPAAMMAADTKGTGMNDYRKIRRRDAGKLSPPHTAKVHAESRLALTQFLDLGDRAKSVVITHHAPSAKSVSLRREKDVLNAAYASNLDDLVAERGPALWIHGHIHEQRDYTIANTRILNNPLGYQTEREPEQTGFRADLVVEI